MFAAPVLPKAARLLVGFAMCYEFFFWLSAFPDDFQHPKASELGRRHTLNLPGWMKTRLTANQTEVEQYPPRTILGLVKAHTKAVWAGPLTQMDVEEQLLWNFWHFPSDAWFFSVDAVWPVTAPFQVHEAECTPHFRCMDKVWRRNTVKDSFVRSSTSTQPFKPVMPGFSWQVQLQHRNEPTPNLDSDVLANLRVLPQPNSVCRLLLAEPQAWVSLVALGRWAELSASLPELFQESIGPSGAEPPQPSQVDLTASSCQEVANHIRRWAPCVLASLPEERMHLEAAVCWLDNISWNFPADGYGLLQKSKLVYSSLFLVKMLLLMRLIPGSVDVKTLLIDAVSLLFPNLLKSVCEKLLHKPKMFPSPGTRHQARLVLDAALLLWRRRETGTYVRFGGADSSPQAGFDFLLSSTDYILTEQVVPVWEAVIRMMKEADMRCEGRWEQQSDQSIADHVLVRQHLRKEDDIPTALGNSAATAAHKVAGMLHKYSLRCENESALAAYLSSFFSFCSDMGTEINISGFRIQNLEALLPTWMRKTTLDEDVQGAQWQPMVLESDVSGMCDGQVHQPLVSEGQPQNQNVFTSNTFLPEALSIPGMLHITSNGLQQVTSLLAHFDDWFSQLKVIEHLWNKGRLVRFVNFCVRPHATPEIVADFLGRKPGSLYLKRWNEVSKFCLRIRDLLPYLKAFWNEDAFCSGKSAAGLDRADAEFDPGSLTIILQDAMFEALLG